MNEQNKKNDIFFSSQLLLFSQSTMDIMTYDDDFDVCIQSNCTKICYIEDDGTKNKK